MVSRRWDPGRDDGDLVIVDEELVEMNRRSTLRLRQFAKGMGKRDRGSLRKQRIQMDQISILIIIKMNSQVNQDIISDLSIIGVALQIKKSGGVCFEYGIEKSEIRVFWSVILSSCIRFLCEKKITSINYGGSGFVGDYSACEKNAQNQEVDQVLSEDEKNAETEDLAKKQGTRTRLFKPVRGFVSPRKRAPAKTDTRKGDNSKQAESKGASNPKSGYAKNYFMDQALLVVRFRGQSLAIGFHGFIYFTIIRNELCFDYEMEGYELLVGLCGNECVIASTFGIGLSVLVVMSCGQWLEGFQGAYLNEILDAKRYSWMRVALSGGVYMGGIGQGVLDPGVNEV
ncbi:hypothetical protein IGI04_035972 [Brassica rapa subsp. trilocularis]|uniref:Uncharacterized protein n=1 Tax=Brassica rapa subsp. trilocularis TaxID=1813537 RepID=A0ABQ7LD35_BRACM|nr:hypothetical protein IGI04_035972 [Brassica rapa subsp. trilocularis]